MDGYEYLTAIRFTGGRILCVPELPQYEALSEAAAWMDTLHADGWELVAVVGSHYHFRRTADVAPAT